MKCFKEIYNLEDKTEKALDSPASHKEIRNFNRTITTVTNYSQHKKIDNLGFLIPQSQ